MTNQDPLTPPPELVEQWANMIASGSGQAVFAMAAQWGADQELNECCHLLRLQGFDAVDDLRAARRPKPSSLKEQALEAQQRMWNGTLNHDDWNLVRRALEALPND